MRQGILVLNLLMLVGTAVLADQLISGWEAFDETNSVERLVGRVEPGQDAPANVGIVLEEGARPFPEFLVIAEKNLFTPQRGPEVEAEVEPEEEKAPVLPMKPALTGVSTGKGVLFLRSTRGKRARENPAPSPSEMTFKATRSVKSPTRRSDCPGVTRK